MAPPVRTRQPEETRARIIDAAIKTAHELGAGGFTLDAVVARLPHSKGALLHHFPSKLVLLEAVIDHLGEEFTDKVRAAAAEDADSYARLSRAYLRVTISEVGQPEDISLGKVALIACLIEPALADRWNAHTRAVYDADLSGPAEGDDALMLRLLADGLWLSDLMGGYAIPPDQRQALLHLLDPRPAKT